MLQSLFTRLVGRISCSMYGILSLIRPLVYILYAAAGYYGMDRGELPPKASFFRGLWGKGFPTHKPRKKPTD